MRVFCIAALFVGCGGASGEAGPPKARRPPPALRTFLPPGAAWIVEARPKALWKAPETQRALQGAIAEADLVDFAARTGVDLRAVDEALAAGYGEGVVWIARGGHDATDVTKRLRERLRPVERDDARRGLAGILLGHPAALRRLGPRAIAFGDDADRTVEGLGRGRRLPPEATSLSSRLGDAPLRLLHLGPLDLPPDSGAGVLLARIERAGFSLVPEGGLLRVRIVLAGELPASASENLRTLLTSLGESGLGRAFGADAAARRAGVTVTPAGADIEVTFDPAEVDTGIRTLFVEDLRALFSAP